MIRDPIVEELHKIRAEILRECGGDLDKVCEMLKDVKPLEGQRVVTREEMLCEKYRKRRKRKKEPPHDP